MKSNWRCISILGCELTAISAVAGLLLTVTAITPTWAQAKKPNILIIWGDDIGYWNVSAYNHGMMGYKTPNIDSIAKEGALFTDWYGQQSCTAGRAALITGQSPCFVQASSRSACRAQRRACKSET